MQWRDISWHPPAKTLCWFGVFLAGLLGALAWRAASAENTVSAALLGMLAGLVLALALVRPQPLRYLYVTWMVAVFPISWVVSHVLLALVFYCVFTPIGLIFKLIGRDPLCRHQPAVDSYWTAKPVPTDVRRYFQQF